MVKFSPTHITKASGAAELKLRLFLNFALYTGEFLSAHISRFFTADPLDRRLAEPQSAYGIFEKNKNSLIYSGIHNPDRWARSLVITQSVQAPEMN